MVIVSPFSYQKEQMEGLLQPQEGVLAAIQNWRHAILDGMLFLNILIHLFMFFFVCNINILSSPGIETGTPLSPAP